MGWKNRIRQARNRLDNVDDEISSLLNQIRVEQDEEVILKKSKNLSSLEKQAIFDLFEKNMMDLYQQCGWDCSYESKRKELFDKNSIFVLVRTFGSSIKGYGMFRFEEDDEEYPEFPVIYLYELQVDVLYRSKGVASRIIDFLCGLNSIVQLDKMMLTCLKINESAMKFYFKQGFQIDESSPSKYDQEACYEILSKSF